MSWGDAKYPGKRPDTPATFSLEGVNSLPIGVTSDGRAVLAVGRVAIDDGGAVLIVLVREPTSPTGLRWERCSWSPHSLLADWITNRRSWNP